MAQADGTVISAYFGAVKEQASGLYAQAMAEKGGKLVIASRGEEKLKALRDSLPSCDISYKTADFQKYNQKPQESHLPGPRHLFLTA